MGGYIGKDLLFGKLVSRGAPDGLLHRPYRAYGTYIFPADYTIFPPALPGAR